MNQGLEHPEEAARLLLNLYLGIAPFLLVHVVGLVLALVLMRARHRRGPMSFLGIGLFLKATSLAARPYFNYTLTTSDATLGLSGEEIRNRLTAFNVAASVVDTIGLALVIAAAVCWRGARQATPGAATAFAPAPGSVPPRATAHGAVSMPRLSYGARIALMYVPLLLSLPFSIMAFSLLQRQSTLTEGLAVLGVALALLIPGMVAFAFTIHALWKTIQAPPVGVGLPGVARTTPGRAVGFLFIPFFGVYWVFQVWVGLATDTNRTLDQLAPAVPRLSRGLAIAICICTLLSIIPFVGLVFSLANLVMLPIFLWSAFRAANTLRGAEPVAMTA